MIERYGSRTDGPAPRIPRRGPARLAFAALGLAWGLDPVYLARTVPAFGMRQVALLGVACAFPPLLACAAATRALRWRHLRHLHRLVATSVLTVAFPYLAFAEAAGRLSPGLAATLSGFAPAFALLATQASPRGTSVDGRAMGAVLLGFAGILLIPFSGRNGGGVDVAAELWMVAGACSLGLAFVHVRRSVVPLRLPPVAAATYQVGIAVPLLLAATDVRGMGRILGDPGSNLGPIVGLGLCGTALAAVLFHFVSARFDALRASGVAYLAALVAVAVDAAADGRLPDPVDAVAALLVVVALALQRRPTAGGDDPTPGFGPP